MYLTNRMSINIKKILRMMHYTTILDFSVSAVEGAVAHETVKLFQSIL